MPNINIYIREKLNHAIECLATGKGNIKQRLEDAYYIYHPLLTDDFPKALQKDYEWVIKEMTKFGPKLKDDGTVFKGAVPHTMQRIRNNTGEKIAKRIYFLYCEMNNNENYR